MGAALGLAVMLIAAVAVLSIALNSQRTPFQAVHTRRSADPRPPGMVRDATAREQGFERGDPPGAALPDASGRGASAPDRSGPHPLGPDPLKHDQLRGGQPGSGRHPSSDHPSGDHPSGDRPNAEHPGSDLSEEFPPSSGQGGGGRDAGLEPGGRKGAPGSGRGRTHRSSQPPDAPGLPETADGRGSQGQAAPAEPGPATVAADPRPLRSQATARVMSLVDERQLGPVTKSRLTLRVEPDGADPFEVVARVAFSSPEARSRVKVGSVVPVRYDAEDHRRVVVEVATGDD